MIKYPWAVVAQRSDTKRNNLKLNPAKYSEVVFFDKRLKVRAQPPPPIPGIHRSTIIKIFGVTITNGLSVSEHVRTVIGSCAQTMYALKVMRAHGIDDTALQAVYRSVVVTKLQYASSAWWDSPTRLIGIAWWRSSDALPDATSLQQTWVHSNNSAKPLMSSCSTAFSATQITFCTIYCLHNPKHL